jgi:hypothetical protein
MDQRADFEFIKTKLPTVEGWLENPAAYVTSTLLRTQTAEKVSGGIFEIGVFAGKYLSLLYHLTQQSGEIVLGMDTFEWYPQANVDRNFKSVFGQCDRLKLMKLNSTKATPEIVTSALGGKPRFISVDGAHTAPEVYGDIKLAESVLADGGIVAIDDLLNPHAIGVSEGAYRYFLTRGAGGLVPFAYCANKLFISRAADCERYRRALESFLNANADLPFAVDFLDRLKKGRHWADQILFSVPVLII